MFMRNFLCICLDFVFCVSDFTLAGVHQTVKTIGWVLHSPSRDQVFSGHIVGTHGYLSEFLWLDLKLRCVLDNQIWLKLNKSPSWEPMISFGCNEHSRPILVSSVKASLIQLLFSWLSGLPWEWLGLVLSLWYGLIDIEYLLLAMTG